MSKALRYRFKLEDLSKYS